MDAYKIETNTKGKKYVEVGNFVIYLYSDRVEVTLDDDVVEIIDYMVIEPTKAEKLEILSDVIQKYHGITTEPCPFD